ncbi:MAG: hypothetical protein ACRELD_05350 [Longimicrobiales bacterium]
MRTILSSAALLAATVLIACGGPEADTDTAADAQGTADQADRGMEGMRGMAGMEGMQGMGGGMMERMQAHMQMMQGMSGDSMMAMMPQHRQMAANMIAQFNREMREMNMATDAEWNALVDSLRADLTRMPELSMAEMQALMPEHHARMRRLMQMHQSMMDDTQM